MMDVLQAYMNAREEKKACALLTVVKTEGAAPRGPGAKMLVFRDGSTVGSIGGGAMEKQALADAARCIAGRENALLTYENRVEGEGEGAPCGGVITVFIEPEEGAPELVVCGAGHVGAAVIRLASGLGFHVTALDTRDTEITAENVQCTDRFIHIGDFYSGVKSLETSPQAFFLIATYGHAQDADALAAILEKGALYIGMLGSKAKIGTIFTKLREKGYSEGLLSSVRTPVGLDIGGETPEEVAFSIVAEMQMVRYGGTGRPMRETI